METTAERIKRLLALKNLSKAEAERRAGLTRGYLHDIIKKGVANPGSEYMVALADVLDCDVDYLLLRQDTIRAMGDGPPGLTIFGVIADNYFATPDEAADAVAASSPIPASPFFPLAVQGAFRAVDSAFLPLGIAIGDALTVVPIEDFIKTGWRIAPRDFAIAEKKKGAMIGRTLATVASVSDDGSISAKDKSGEPLARDWVIKFIVVQITKYADW